MTLSRRCPLLFPASLAAILVCLLVFLPEQSEARSCVFQCMRSVISCKRKAALKIGGADACCQEYFKCFLDCKPDAKEPPACDSGKGKRPQWGKRADEEAEDRLQFFNDFL